MVGGSSGRDVVAGLVGDKEECVLLLFLREGELFKRSCHAVVGVLILLHAERVFDEVLAVGRAAGVAQHVKVVEVERLCAGHVYVDFLGVGCVGIVVGGVEARSGFVIFRLHEAVAHLARAGAVVVCLVGVAAPEVFE